MIIETTISDYMTVYMIYYMTVFRVPRMASEDSSEENTGEDTTGGASAGHVGLTAHQAGAEEGNEVCQVTGRRRPRHGAQLSIS